MGQGDTNRGQSGETALNTGVELFNRRDFFHAHEVWEDWWRLTTHPEKPTVQGMIQVAVALHHFSAGNFEGALSVMERAFHNLEDAPNDFYGIDIEDLLRKVRHAIEQLRIRQAVTLFEIVRK